MFCWLYRGWMDSLVITVEMCRVFYDSASHRKLWKSVRCTSSQLPPHRRLPPQPFHSSPVPFWAYVHQFSRLLRVFFVLGAVLGAGGPVGTPS